MTDIVRDLDNNIIFSVSEISFHIKQVLETQLENFYIIGEISNFKTHSSGHLYFNLKDENAVLRCVFFRNQNYSLDFNPVDGDEVVCFGKITVYEKSGQYQLSVLNMIPYGKGALQLRYEQLKKKLKTEGLFDIEHKKPLPKYPDSIGVITSPTSAALQDILNILQRRYPCNVIVFPSLMQGEEASKQVMHGIDYFNKNKVDVLIIARGGGSQEDLFCFNDEDLARKIFDSNIPIVSAIGHEIDFTIADFVSDLRAPTPSAAAELITPDIGDVRASITKTHKRITTSIINSIILFKTRIDKNHLMLIHKNPTRILQSLEQRYDESMIFIKNINEEIKRKRKDYSYIELLFTKDCIKYLDKRLQNKKHKCEITMLNFNYNVITMITYLKHKVDLMNKLLAELSPVELLRKGYSIIKKEGRIIKSIKQLSVDETLDIVLNDGSAQVNVIEIKQ